MFAVLVRFTDKFGATRYKTYGSYPTDSDASCALMALDSFISAYIQVDSLEVIELESFIVPKGSTGDVEEVLPVQQPVLVQPQPHYTYPLAWQRPLTIWGGGLQP